MVCKDEKDQINAAKYMIILFLGVCLVVDSNRRPTVDAIIAQLYPIVDKLGENFGYPQVSVM